MTLRRLRLALLSSTTVPSIPVSSQILSGGMLRLRTCKYPARGSHEHKRNRWKHCAKFASVEEMPAIRASFQHRCNGKRECRSTQDLSGADGPRIHRGMVLRAWCDSWPHCCVYGRKFLLNPLVHTRRSIPHLLLLSGTQKKQTDLHLAALYAARDNIKHGQNPIARRFRSHDRASDPHRPDTIRRALVQGPVGFVAHAAKQAFLDK